jgi:selenophosphate synthase
LAEQHARGGGCTCKIRPGELEETIGRLVPDGPGADLMVGVEHGDDGAVVRVSPAMAVVVTADLFTPVVDDAYTFGRIAAANALSDIYAMGGEPLVALLVLVEAQTSGGLLMAGQMPGASLIGEPIPRRDSVLNPSSVHVRIPEPSSTLPRT